MEDLHKIWPHRWINSKAESFTSPIQGFGVRTKNNINKGEIVMVIGGIIIPRQDIYKYRDIMGHIGIQVHNDFWIVPSDKKEAEETGIPNHSCNPNIGFDNSICYIAIREIKKEEELLLDYAFMESEFKSFKCNCKSENCRKEITKDDWKIKSIQKE